jgi:hypothetical protein
MSTGSIIVPTYATGEYFATHADPDQDAAFKAQAFLDLFRPLARSKQIKVRSYIDVGCGGGRTAVLIKEGLEKSGHAVDVATGYDVFPGVNQLAHAGIHFVCQDFCQSNDRADLVTLFDVAEHVPDTITFLKNVASRCSLIALHIPLDNSLANALLNRFRRRLSYPKHVLFLDVASALNLTTLAGIMPLDYSFTFGYQAPSGSMSALQKLSYPFRWAISHVSPWLASKTVGGVSLMVIGATPKGLEQYGA